jgi:hypothetical protein
MGEIRLNVGAGGGGGGGEGGSIGGGASGGISGIESMRFLPWKPTTAVNLLLGLIQEYLK